MTIDEFCRQQHVSKKTVYERLRRRGVEPSALRDEKRQLTSEGLSILGSLFDSVSAKETFLQAGNETGTAVTVTENAVKTEGNSVFKKGNAETIREMETQIHELEKQNAALKAENRQLTERLEDALNQRDKAQEEAREQREAAQADRDKAREENAALIATLEAVRQTQQLMQQRLLPEKVEEGRGGWFARLFGRK